MRLVLVMVFLMLFATPAKAGCYQCNSTWTGCVSVSLGFSICYPLEDPVSGGMRCILEGNECGFAGGGDDDGGGFKTPSAEEALDDREVTVKKNPFKGLTFTQAVKLCATRPGCQIAVPKHVSTWGSLKVMYR